MTSKVYPHLAAAADANANLFISPVSLSQGLGLAFIGARGGTREEIGRVLGWDSARNVPALIKSYNAQLTDTGDADTTLGIANALWLAKGLPIRNEYVAEARSGFGAAPETVDYAGDPTGAAARINGWVSRETKGRISEIVSSSGFGDDTAAVLTNALYFKAKWQVPFEETETRSFTRGDGTRIPITMMKRIGRFDYRETREGQAIALPYGSDGRFVMEVFLPRDAATLRRWERDMRGVDFFAGEQGSNDRFALAAEQEREVRIILPRFEARFDESVKAALIAAGMPSAFDSSRADLSGIASGMHLAIDDVAHATFLRVDEEGTEAAAATAVTVQVVSAPIKRDVPEMVVDRPFLATVRDRKSGAVLFFGRIADPTAIP
ncbi:serpin family protein [Novosphingobium sp. EMRT-2]|uniref:serpin family protein n=1 Tax=Novosphingobium sp. EMRT-2 TaxID=2571749 RepID=UPI0010BD1B55|nr:serpin family protein [Novosphingobium sp. EMRT-2]QCI96237.1 serpin family protein [Novosphingobium sp. EMRT-2]